MAVAIGRVVQKVSPFLVGIYVRRGLLKMPETALRTAIQGYRRPTIEDLEKLDWYIASDGFMFEADGTPKRISAAAATIERYDYHTASDVLDVVTIGGTARGCREIVLELLKTAKVSNRRLIASVRMRDYNLARFCSHMGASPTSTVYEVL